MRPVRGAAVLAALLSSTAAAAQQSAPAQPAPAQAAPAQAAPAQPAPASPCPPGTVPAAQQPEGGPFICILVQPAPQQPRAPTTQAPAQPAPAPAPTQAPATTTSPAAPPTTNPPPTSTRTAPSTATASAPPTAPHATTTTIPEPTAAPAQPTKEELAQATRALERALVQQGGLTLAPGHLEVVPQLTYALSEGTALLRTGAGEVNVGTRSEIYTGAVTLRVGLPFRFQAEVTAPFIWSRWTGLSQNLDDPPTTGSGVGDVTVGATWHALRAVRYLPDLLVSGFWKARNGQSALDDPTVKVPIGSGIETFGGSVSLLKPIDPVVLLVSGRYTHSVPRWAPFGWLDAGDEYGLTASANLAVSPETSLSFGLEQGYAQLVRVDGEPVPHSDRTPATFRVGVTTLASRHTMLEVGLGIGLTSDVPRFQVNVGAPIQF